MMVAIQVRMLVASDQNDEDAAVTSVVAMDGSYVVTAVGPGGESATCSTPDQYHEVGQLVGSPSRRSHNEQRIARVRAEAV